MSRQRSAARRWRADDGGQRPRLISDKSRKKISDGGDAGRTQRSKNAKARQAAFPVGLVDALNARHIDGDPDELLRILRGWDIESDEPSPGCTLLGGRVHYRLWDFPASVRDADADLVARLADVATFYPGDPRAPEPLHLVPLHVAVLALRRVVQGHTGAFVSAMRALDMTARELAQGHGKPASALETADAAANCHAAIALLLTYDRLPREVRRLLGRCQNPRCRRGQPWMVGLEVAPTACDGGCRVRVAEARRAVHSSQSKRKNQARSARRFSENPLKLRQPPRPALPSMSLLSVLDRSYT